MVSNLQAHPGFARPSLFPLLCPVLCSVASLSMEQCIRLKSPLRPCFCGCWVVGILSLAVAYPAKAVWTGHDAHWLSFMFPALVCVSPVLSFQPSQQINVNFIQIRIQYGRLCSCYAMASLGSGENGHSGIRVEQDFGMMLRTSGLTCGCWHLGERRKERRDAASYRVRGR